MSQFSNQNVVGSNTHLDPAATSCIVSTGTGATSGEYLLDVPAGGRGMVITMVSYSVAVASSSSAQSILFWRRPVAGVAAGQRAVSHNSGAAGGATTMTIPATQAVGDVFRVFFGADTNQDHVLNPGESFAVELDITGTTEAATGAITVHGYSFDAGPQIDVLGDTHLTAVTKDNANGSGSIFNLIA